MADEMLWLVQLPLCVWEVLGCVAEMGAVELRSRCIAGAQTSSHFIWRRVLEPAGDLPWPLFRGGAKANLEELMEGQHPTSHASDICGI